MPRFLLQFSAPMEVLENVRNVLMLQEQQRAVQAAQDRLKNDQAEFSRQTQEDAERFRQHEAEAQALLDSKREQLKIQVTKNIISECQSSISKSTGSFNEGFC